MKEGDEKDALRSLENVINIVLVLTVVCVGQLTSLTSLEGSSHFFLFLTGLVAYLAEFKGDSEMKLPTSPAVVTAEVQPGES